MFFTAAAAIGIASSLAGLYETTAAQKAALESINIQTKQRELQISQKKLSVYSKTSKILKTQEAQATVRGIGAGSPSFNAIQRETMNIGSKNFQNINTEEDFLKVNSRLEKENVRRSTQAKLFAEAASMGLSFASLSRGKSSGKDGADNFFGA